MAAVSRINRWSRGLEVMAEPEASPSTAVAPDRSFAELVRARAREQPDQVAFRYKMRGVWHDVSWEACAKRMTAVAAGLAELGVKPGDCVAVAAPASPAWLFAILGVHAAGALPLSVYQGLPPGDLAAVFADQKVTAAIAELGWLEMLVDNTISLPGVVVLTDSQRPAEWVGGAVVMLADLEDKGGVGSSPGADAATPAFLFATAGTGGSVKVVAHSARSLVAAARAVAEPDSRLQPLGRQDTTVVELPTGHVGALLAAIVLPATHGVVSHLPEVKAADAVREVHPTLSINLAGAWERTAARVQVAASGTRGLKGFLFRLAQRVRRSEFDRGAKQALPSSLLAHLAYLAIFFPLLSKLGLERLRAAYVVGVTSPDELSLWRAWGVKLTQAYGLAEAGPIVARASGTSLTPAAGLEIKLGRGGALLVRGDAVCTGYRRQGKVHPAVDDDGWLDTGDLGAEAGEGIRVFGERADIVDEPGGRIPLSLIDAVLRYSPYVRVAITAPAGRGGGLEARVVADLGSIARWATAHGVSYRSPAALAESDGVTQLFKEELVEANRRLERRSLRPIESIAVATAPLEAGVVTPTGSVRRSTTRRDEPRLAPILPHSSPEAGRA